ncbi:hypothetical protein BC937DRAFT_95172 [Endogone sp. FLAS-F59071]|nr:hypothetical protein BC937DRAFT_95172 [Endogone sp. FLAS-F59071]|eukprot:RUS13531.1 hypothetical protein BC937DRAFT_95172 [Endogone sp. FLAS-F59071]
MRDNYLQGCVFFPSRACVSGALECSFRAYTCHKSGLPVPERSVAVDLAVTVNPDSARLERVRDFNSLGDVGEDSNSEAVSGHVGLLNYLLNGLELGKSDDRASLTFVDVRHDVVILGLGDLRSPESSLFERITDLDVLRNLLEATEELVVDTLLDVDARPNAASLAVVEDTQVCPLYGLIEIGIVKDNVGRLTAKL